MNTQKVQILASFDQKRHRTNNFCSHCIKRFTTSMSSSKLQTTDTSERLQLPIKKKVVGLSKRNAMTFFPQCLQIFSAAKSLKNLIFLSEYVSPYVLLESGKFVFI